MGKDLKGRELGVGISQKKDGRYSARYSSYDGRRIERNFKTYKDARNWIALADTENEYSEERQKEMLYDEWFNFWIETIIKNRVSDGTLHEYKKIYNNNIKPEIGGIRACNIKPYHCQTVINKCVDKGLCKGTINSVRVVMSTSLKSAVDNGLIDKNPIGLSEKIVVPFREPKKNYLTEEEQKLLTEYLVDMSWRTADNKMYLALLLIMQTGIRIGELMALHWSDVNFERREIKIMHSMNRNSSKRSDYYVGDAKSSKSRRTIPLTKSAVEILKRVRRVDGSEENFYDLVFLGDKDGLPFAHASYARVLTVSMENVGIEPISVHGLRHTFATRCIEKGVAPKTLQELLGHKSIATTMNLYVHVSDDEKMSAIMLLEDD